MRKTFTKILSTVMVTVATAGLQANAQVTLTKNLPPIGATYDWYVHLNAQTMSEPDTSDNAEWDYRAITTDLQFTKSGSSVIKTLSQISEPDKDSFPGATYVDEFNGGVAPYNTVGRYYYKEDGDLLKQLGSYLKTGPNEQVIMLSDSFFVFNTAYKSGWTTSSTLGNVPYTRRYISYGTFKIRNETYNNAVLFKGEPSPGLASSYTVFTIQPYFSRIAIISVLPNGTGTINYYQPTSATGINDLQDEKSLTVYPNPVIDKLNIISDDLSKFKHYAIYDLNGKEIMSNQYAEQAIDVSSLVRGLYLLKMSTVDGRTIEKRFIKK